MSTVQQLEKDFLVAWRRFRRLLEACQHALAADTDRPLWLYNRDTAQARTALVEIVGQIFFEDDQPPRSSVTLPGIVGASQASLQSARQLNAAKDQLQEVLRTLDSHGVRGTNPATGRVRQQRLSDLVLAKHGLARLHRMQTYRHLRIIDKAPDKVGMTWAHTRRVKKTTVAAVNKELERMHKRGGAQAPLIESDMVKLGYLTADTHLALVDKQPLHARANLAWRTSEGEWRRKQMTVALPLLYPAKVGAPLPALRPLDEPDDEIMRERSQGRRLEDSPYLNTLAVYRYLTSA